MLRDKLRGKPVISFVSKVALQSATAVLATLIGGYVLTALNLREPSRDVSQTEMATDERALTREFVRSLREGRDSREDVAEVRPIVPPSNVHETIVAKGAPGGAVVIERNPVARKESRIRPDVAVVPALGAPVELAPVTVTAIAEADNDPRAVRPPVSQPTGVSAVFSTLSTFIGSAANATGDGINFVIDLPARVLGQSGQNKAGNRSEGRQAPQPAAQNAPESASPLRFAGS